jgi:hypothetical protein
MAAIFDRLTHWVKGTSKKGALNARNIDESSGIKQLGYSAGAVMSKRSTH